MLLACYLSKLFEVQDPMAKLLLITAFIKAFGSFIKSKEKIENVIKFEKIPMVKTIFCF